MTGVGLELRLRSGVVVLGRVLRDRAGELHAAHRLALDRLARVGVRFLALVEEVAELLGLVLHINERHEIRPGVGFALPLVADDRERDLPANEGLELRPLPREILVRLPDEFTQLALELLGEGLHRRVAPELGQGGTLRGGSGLVPIRDGQHRERVGGQELLGGRNGGRGRKRQRERGGGEEEANDWLSFMGCGAFRRSARADARG